MARHKKQATREQSAGGVVIRMTDAGPAVLLIRDHSDVYSFPKGVIEPGESARDASIREIAEETGMRELLYIADLGEISYRFLRNGPVDKTVDYFLYQSSGDEEPVPQTEEYISETRFVTIQEALDMIGYPKTNVPLLKKAISLFRVQTPDAS